MPGTVENHWLEQIGWGTDGLVPVVTQDAASGRVLMLAWMNREALSLTLARREAVYWSRSKRRLWRKGEESGHTLRVAELRLDCDGDALLLKVHTRSGICCHTGRESCFFRQWYNEGGWEAVDPVLQDPVLIYGNTQ